MTCIFDIDNTLYDYDARHAPAYRAVTAYAREELGLEPERFDELHREASRAMRRWTGGNCAAIHDRLIRYQVILELAGAPILHAPRLSGLYWGTFLAGIEPYPGAADCLRGLRGMGIRIGIGTNMTADLQFEKLDRLGLLPTIDFMVSSEQANAEKPDPHFFELCAERAGCAPADCVFIGDDLRGDALGSRDAGMRAVWLSAESAEGAEGVERIASLSELCPLLAASRQGSG